MTELLILFYIPWCLLLAFAVWGVICNERTSKRFNQLYPAPEDPMFWEKAAAFKAVSYDKHLWSMMTFRDPMKLYDPIIFEKSGAEMNHE